MLYQIRAPRRWFLSLAVALVCWQAGLPSVVAEDAVTLSSAANRHARSRISGEVLDYTGKQIVIKLADGREIKRPGQYVVSIETGWPAGKAEADQLFDAQHFHAARDKYAAAIRKETRAWARRAILSRLIACHRELNQLEAAGTLFLALVRGDPDTPYFDQLPLAWFNAELSGNLEKTAQQWLADEQPLAQLLGASHLLVTLNRQEAIDRLAALSLSKDPRISSQAEAQIWRVSVPNANDEKLAAWQRRVESFPERLRAGPYWILGRALAQHGQAEAAALAFLHLPLVYSQARLLAADALSAAAGIVEKQGDAAAALRLRRELAATYPGTPAADQVRSLLPPLEQLAPPAAPAEGDSLEKAFLNGLRARRLFVLAERYGRRRLSEPDVAEAARVNLAVELSRTLAEHALHEAPEKRKVLWKEAVAVVRMPGGEAVGGSRRLLLDAQAAMVHLAQGELARQEAELAGADEAAFGAARQDLRTAVGLFDATLKAVGDALRQANQSRGANQQRGADAADLNESELASLTRSLEYQLARAFRNQGQSYPPQSADRTNSLRQAERRLKLLAAADAEDAVAWPARLDEVTCLRLLEQYSAAQARLAGLQEGQPPAPFAAALQSERIRLALDRGQPDEALAAAEQARGAASEATADLDLACLESYVAAWQAAAKAKRSTEAAAWQERAAESIAEIDSRFGRYWGRRAEMLLAGSVTRGGNTENLAVLVRAADSLFRSGQFEQSLQAYDRAARQAAYAGQNDAAFDHAYTAAAVEQRLKKYADAARRFRQLALDSPRNGRAGEAHLLAIYNTALAAGKDDEAINAYGELLREHLAQWPRSPTADQVRLWLGELDERQRRWPDAIDAYRGVRLDHEKAADAVAGMSRSYGRWLADLSAAGEPTADIAARAANELEAYVVNARGAMPERWSKLERTAAVSAATIWLTYCDGEFARAELLLRAALSDAADAPGEWRTTAQTLEVFAVAAQGHRREAAQLLDDLSGGKPDQVLGLIEGLAKVAAQASPKVARELAELQLRAAELLGDRLSELPAAQARQFRRARLQALAAVGRYVDALKEAKNLAAESPHDGRIQEQYAELLLESSDVATRQAALAKWRDIGKKTRQGSDRWVRAMYAQTLLLTRLGETRQAERLVKLTQAICPDLGGPEMKSKFRELARKQIQRESNINSK